MRIFVKTQTGNAVITLDVEPEDTIQNVKRKIADEVGTPVDRQRLTSQGETLECDDNDVKNVWKKILGQPDRQHVILNDQELADDRTLKYYDIQPGSTLHLYLILRGRIHVKTQTGTMITLEVVPEDTIKNVKKKIFEEGGIAVECTRIVFAGKTLQDQDTLGDYNIRRESILHLIPTRRDSVVPIRLQTLIGKTITLEVAPQDTINDVKKEISRKEGITVERQILFYAGEKLKDHKTLKDYKIWRNSVLNLRLRESPEGKLEDIYKSKEKGMGTGEKGGFDGALSKCQFSFKSSSICIKFTSVCQL